MLGLVEGDALGDLVGCFVGALVGLLGLVDGDVEGDALGLTLGLCEGDTEGDPLGDPDGRALGDSDGLGVVGLELGLVGLGDGLEEGASVGRATSYLPAGHAPHVLDPLVSAT